MPLPSCLRSSIFDASKGTNLIFEETKNNEWYIFISKTAEMEKENGFEIWKMINPIKSIAFAASVRKEN